MEIVKLAWPDIEKQEVPWDKLDRLLQCGRGSLINWCHAQVSSTTLKYRLCEGICFLRSSASWRSEDDITEIKVPVFHADRTKFHQVGLVIAIINYENENVTEVRIELLEGFAEHIIKALRKDILATRLEFG